MNTRWSAAAAVLLLVLSAGTLIMRSPAGAWSSARSAGAPPAPDGGRVPVLLELFTSEGCSSCPPADAILARLLERQPVPGVEIIGLSEHVDYWNRLGWSDPYSDARFTARQQEYARAFARPGLYTPQAVVDGRTEFVGSNLARAVEAVSRASREPKAAIDIDREGRTAGGVTLKIQVARLPTRGHDRFAHVYLAVTENHLSSTVSRGENRGRRLGHAAVVRRMSVLGRVTGTSSFASRTVVPIEAKWKPADLRAVVFAQDPKTRGILGASSIPLK